MPAYSTSAFAPLPEVAIPGKPAYFWGALDTHQQDTLMLVNKVALTSNVATLTVTVVRGNIPAVGNSVSVQGTTGASAAFNVTAVLTGVSITAATGKGTITFALTHADVPEAADAGQAKVLVPETTEALANSTSVAIYVPSQEPVDYGTRSITVATTFPSLPTAATVTLQTAIQNIDSEYTNAGSGAVAVVAGSAQTIGPLNTVTVPAGRFWRVKITGVSGGSSPSIICKMIP